MKKSYCVWHGARGNKSLGPNFQMGRHRLRDLGSVSMKGSWYTLSLAFPSEDSLSPREFPIQR